MSLIAEGLGGQLKISLAVQLNLEPVERLVGDVALMSACSSQT
jgi:hypothetical protein